MVAIELGQMKGCEILASRFDEKSVFVQFHVTLPKKQHEILKSYCKSYYLSMTDVIRLAIADWLKKNGLNESEVK